MSRHPNWRPPNHWISSTTRAEVHAIWLAGNDFSMKDIANAVGVTEAQVRYAVRDLPKSETQRARSNRSKRSHMGGT